MTNLSLTIKQNGNHEITIKKSRFICTMARISTEYQAKKLIATITKDNPKANHNCFAYVLGDQDQIQRESDNGEPSGTAGVPILEVLKMNELHNVLAVVTRYFGGIKLGAGGLIRAYSNATSTTIDQLGIVNLVTKKELIITIDYNQLDSLNYFLTQKSIPVEDTAYATDVKVTVPVGQSSMADFKQQLMDLFSGNVHFTEGQDKLFEEPFSRQQREKKDQQQ